ncbi:fimbria/pilus periplasmic chaperone [Vibrio vulnificus]|uniref:fimbria/pilus periplasmic chaperone n=1 Tax=Vibrio vulnificus TaxID=672 RepID=UPI0005F2502A|nr:fimbria/pilus periplasmic chaperone [Vibrio vulnificus]
MNKKKVFFAALLSIFTVNSAFAALALDATRYVYKGNEPFLTAIVNNQSDKDFGAQVWVDNIAEKDTRPTFIATPSFFKVKGNGSQVFRIMKVTDQMPKDKESIYWLNLQEIPQKNKGNGLAIAIRTRVKVIYRPEAILGHRDNAESNIKVENLPGEKWLVNTTPYIFTIGSVIDENDKPIEFSEKEKRQLTMFKPGDRVNVTDHEVKAVNALNDYGNLKTYELNQYIDKHNKTRK